MVGYMVVRIPPPDCAVRSSTGRFHRPSPCPLSTSTVLAIGVVEIPERLVTNIVEVDAEVLTTRQYRRGWLHLDIQRICLHRRCFRIVGGAVDDFEDFPPVAH